MSKRNKAAHAADDAAGAADERAAGAAAAAEAADRSAEEAAGEVDRLTRELEELQDRHLRLAAEYDNFRKRTAKERIEGRGRAQADLVARLIDSLDDLDRVAELDPEQAASRDVVDGVALVDRKLRRELENAGLERIGAEGEPFDPNTMEAMGSIPTDDPDQDHTVAIVFQPGYRFGGHLVRPARVQVHVHEGGADGDG